MRTSRNHDHKLISLADAAAQIGVHPRTIRRRIAAGDLTGYRVGTKLLRVDAAELDRLAQRIPTAGSAA